MARGPRHKEGLTEEEIRERVNRVMDDWRSYPDFAHLFDALMRANDNLENKEFARLFAEATGRDMLNTIDRVRKGISPPTYPFVASILAHNVLSLESERIRPADQGRPPGDHRIALFAAAGFIEVTAESIREWNSEVLAGWQRWQERHPAGPKLSWKELMHKLLSFHTQGYRCTYEDIAEAANTHGTYGCRLTAPRVLIDLLSGNSVPTQAEREALAKVARLDAAQVSLIETSIEDGSLPIHPEASLNASAFPSLLDDILSRLRVAGINQRQLILRTRSAAGGNPEVAAASLSMWKGGRARPVLESLRALIRGLEQCRSKEGLPLVTPEEIQQLVETAGFSMQQLTSTTHDLIARIDGTTRIKPLLWALRTAADLSVAMTSVDGIQVPGMNSDRFKLSGWLAKWESERRAEYPTAAQVRDVLARYNRLLHTNCQEVLSADEIDKVAEVAERDRAAAMRLRLC